MHALWFCAVLASSPLSPQESRDAIVVDKGLRVELVACEPQVIDPVSIRFDERGRLWVVEMRDYPTGPREGQGPQGRIKILRDRDGDGFYETATTFADGLVFPTGVQPWRDGVIVTLAGAIEYFADQNGDDVHDVRERWFQGFAEENTQLRANHPTLAPDGRVYIGNGLRAGKVEAVGKGWVARPEPLAIVNRDFTFDPRGGDWLAETGGGQFGLSITDDNQRIVCSNRNPADWVAFPASLLQRDSLITAQQALLNVGRSGNASLVQPLVKAWTTSNLHAGQFTAACGVHVFGGTALPPEYHGNLFVCDPTGSLVQRQAVSYEGCAMVSARMPGTGSETEPTEFLASRDPWFRAVEVSSGPDGAIYITDMYRAVIEHPDFVPVELKNRPDERLGDDRGRIYRVVAADTKPSAAGLDAFAKATSTQLIELLDHSDRWYRETAGRLLWEQTSAADHPAAQATGSKKALPAEAVGALQSKLTNHGGRPEGRCRALYLLHSMEHTDSAALEAALRAGLEDPAGEVRATAVRLSANLPKLHERCWALADDDDARVRFAVALLIGEQPSSSDDRFAAWLKLVNRDAGDPLLRTALMAVAADDTATLLSQLLAKWISNPDQAAASQLQIAEHLAQRIGQAPEPLVIFDALQPLIPDPLQADKTKATDQQAGWILSLMNRWNQGLVATRRQPSQVIAATTKSNMVLWEAVLKLAELRAMQASLPEAARVQAIELLKVDRVPQRETALLTLMQETPSPALRTAAMETLSARGCEELPNYLMANLAQFSPDQRRRAVDALLTRTPWIQKLLDGLEQAQVPRGLIDLVQVQRLLRSSDPKVAERANQLLAASSRNRQAVIDQYAKICSQPGNAKQGKQIFVTACSACHRIGEIGQNVGPDISDSRTKTVDQLLQSILDPDAAIDAGFVKYTVLTTDGRVLDGLLVDDTSERITLRPIEGPAINIPRHEIETLKSTGVSLMPTGFETTIRPAAMRDLIAYIKQWRYLEGDVPADVKAIK